MSFLLDEQKGVSQFLINWFLISETLPYPFRVLNLPKVIRKMRMK